MRLYKGRIFNLTATQYFYIIGIMENKQSTFNAAQVVLALSALAQESRLAIFRQLVQAGSMGLTPSHLAQTLMIPAATLSFHLKTLQHAQLIVAEHAGRQIVYRAAYVAMNEVLAYLTENCCGQEDAAVLCCH